MIKVNYLHFLIATFLSSLLLYLCFPGFMSYDSIQMLEEARTQVNGGIFPTTPVYILRAFDFAGFGPSLMIWTQNFLLIFGLLTISAYSPLARFKSLTLIGFIFIFPTVIGCMLVLWKDVTLAATIVCSIACIYLCDAGLIKKQKAVNIAKWASLLLMLIAALIKFNALSSTFVTIIYWIHVFLRARPIKLKALIFIVVFTTTALFVKVINQYRFPSLDHLAPNNLIFALMANDLLGISKWSRHSLIPFDTISSTETPKSAIQDIDAIYSSLGSAVIHSNNIKNHSPVQIYPAKYDKSDIVKAWLNAIQTYPQAYLHYRWDLFSEIIGLIDGPTYEPTHYNTIDENRFGIKFKPQQYTNTVLAYIYLSSTKFWGKPWFVMLISSLAIWLANFAYRKSLSSDHLRLLNISYACGLLNVLPYFFISLSGEVRYSFVAMTLFAPSTVFFFSLVALSFIKFTARVFPALRSY